MTYLCANTHPSDKPLDSSSQYGCWACTARWYALTLHLCITLPGAWTPQQCLMSYGKPLEMLKELSWALGVSIKHESTGHLEDWKHRADCCSKHKTCADSNSHTQGHPRKRSSLSLTPSHLNLAPVCLQSMPYIAKLQHTCPCACTAPFSESSQGSKWG